MDRVKVLDGLRGYASLMVLLAHFPQVENSRIAKFVYHLVSYSKMGYLGVDFFFVLSGFLITRIIINDKKAEKFSLKKFYNRRILRIFPVYYLTIIIIGLISTWDKIFFTTTFTYNYSYPFENIRYPFEHFWSLCVEEQFYVLFPIVLYFFSLHNSQNIIQYYIPLFCVFAAFTTYGVLENSIADKMVFSSSYCRILSLSFGGVLAFKENQIRKKDFIRKKYIIILVIMCILYILGIESDQFNDYLPSPIIRLIAFSVFSTLFILLVINLEGQTLSFKNIFSNSIIRFVGAISYGLYMYHYPVIYFFGETYKDYIGIVSVKDAILILILSFSFAISSYFLIEKPIMIGSKKHKLI